MTLEPALPAKRLRYNIKTEMGFPARPMSGMALVPMRFIFDVQALGRESLAQLCGDEIAGLHGWQRFRTGLRKVEVLSAMAPFK